ncbi:MAG: FG-GAP-like repeat-containing protein [Gemmatimonadales bacterium]
MRVALRLAPALVACLSLAACRARPTPPWHQAAGYRWRELDVEGGTPGFTSMSAGRTGVRFQNTVSDSALLENRILAQGGGVCLGDVDGDGRPDIFLAATEGSSKLYRNRGDWHFDDITQSAGVAAADRHSTGCAFADIDGDGDLDLILLSTTGPNSIFINDGSGHFTEHRDLGLDPAGHGGTTVTLADVDGDGYLDMYVANYKPYSPADRSPPGAHSFSQTVVKDAFGHYVVRPELARDYKLIVRPDLGGTFLTMRGERDQFYHNDHGRFVAESLSAGRFRGADGAPLADPPESFALTARFADLNGDGAPDLYVANDFEDPDLFFLNDGRGNFRLADWAVQRQMSNSSMGVDVGDVNGDGLPDLFVTDMLANDSRRLKTELPANTEAPKKPGEMRDQPQRQHNSLLLNRGDGTFAEVSSYAGVQASGWSWSTMMLDVDLDGWQDILIANGHLWDLMDADTQERLQNRTTSVDWRRERWEYPKLGLTNVAFRNRGDSTFEDASKRWRFGTEPDISHAMAAADLDGDGDLDVVVNRLDAPALLLRNDAKAPRIAVRLIGDAPNTMAVGAKIVVRGGPAPIEEHEVAAGGLYLSHSDYLASFATGVAKHVSIEVDWRDGRRTVIDSAAPNRLYEITARSAARPAARDTTHAAPPLFEDATAMLGGHVHAEDTFDDWGRQYLLPDALSELGPGVAWFDADRDGAEDLIVGSGKGGHIALFHNEHGRLVAQPASGPVAPADYTATIGYAEDGVARLLAGVSTWEARTDSEMMAQPAAVSFGVAHGRLAPNPTPIVGSHRAATGPIALGDYDGDGRLDLFVGSRAIPLHYPEAPSSGLFHNAGGGKFVLDTANSAVLAGIGMVSAAMFADVNGDGHPDLVLAREWGSIALLLNDGHGHFSAEQNAWGLGGWSGRWLGIAAGDLDGDGRLDLIATSWGRNTATQVDSARPLALVYGAFGARGEDEMLLAQHDDRLGGLAPLASFSRVRVAMPDVASRLHTFAAYADATVSRVLGADSSRAHTLYARTLDNMVFMNRGDHFDAVPLPSEAQLAPAFYAGVADFDGDGHEDLFLSQNFYPTAPGVQRYDAGRGLLMLGDGHGHLRALPGARSGIEVYGDQRGAAFADFDGDGRVDLAVSQNGAQTRLFRNRGAKPGLRVRLKGPASNPDGIGAQLRVVYGDSMGPVREVQAGSGYWSQNGAVQVLGLSGTATAVWVRWPGGQVTRTGVPRDAREVTVTR